jgi:holin (3TMs family)
MKPFNQTKTGQFIAKEAPAVAEAIGSVLPDSGALGIVKNIINNVSPDNPDKVDMLKEIDGFQVEMEAETTKQIQSFNLVQAAQVSSTDKFTSRARPFIQYMAILYIGYVIIMKQQLDPLLIEMLGGVIVGYQIARTVDKRTGNK